MQYKFMEQEMNESGSDFTKRVNRFMKSKESAAVDVIVGIGKNPRTSAIIKYYDNKPSAVVGKTISLVGKIAKIIDFKGFKRGKK
ncbi:hypothetical protein STV34_07505 [Streptococcus agalactiae]|nr:hypothetical protein [Streptococcus dysgalactiae]QGG98042.1 hypothetical protein EA459_05240 [Streptococcus dysgalactiae subsp. dysgalactiae]